MSTSTAQAPRRARPQTVLEVLETYEPALVAHINGKPLLCAKPHRTPVPMFDYALPRLALCETHLRGNER